MFLYLMGIYPIMYFLLYLYMDVHLYLSVMDVYLYLSVYLVCWENKELGSGVNGKGVVILFVVLWVRRVWLLRRLSTQPQALFIDCWFCLWALLPPLHQFTISPNVVLQKVINHSSASIVNVNLRKKQNNSLSQYLFNYVRSILVCWYIC